MQDIHLTYDGSFEGFLSLVFDLYKNKINPQQISGKAKPAELFSSSVMKLTDLSKADRVLSGLVTKSSKNTARFIYHCFLSELDGIELKLVHLIKLIFSGQSVRIKDFSDPIIVDLHRVKKMISREVHRMHAFVRFQETKDQMWACEINPDFNVLPLIGKHFKDRYPALEWIIIDTRRQYAIHYNQSQINYATFEGESTKHRITASHVTDQEHDYQAMWKQYFKSVNIEERNNEALHIRHVPKRYWQYLIEKQ